MRTNRPALGARVRRGLAAFATATAILTVAPLTSAIAAEQEVTLVTVDQAFVIRLSGAAGAVVIGNPAIADATIMDSRTLVITGRSFGTTNLIVLDTSGAVIAEKLITVQSAVNQLTVYRRSTRQTYSCTPICAPTLNVGDADPIFALTNEQILARAALALGN